MKTKRNILMLISLFFLITKSYSFSFENRIAKQSNDSIKLTGNEIYVSLTGDDRNGDGSFDKSYKTIQEAIDNAQNGDVIIVMPGRYRGTGNININPKAKEIEIRSINPLDSGCLNNTIIDAGDKGLIARFTNDENSKTIFNGFSLMCGDTIIPINRGIPGFFEFSNQANPTIKNIRIFGEIETSKNYLKSTNLLATSDNWNNPFIQPVATTDYYGSGDANKDGLINKSDYDLLNEIINGPAKPNIRCDVDGDGQITPNDASQLLNSINNSTTLPSSWNYLTGKTQRNNWVDKMIENDKTNNNLYDIYYQCLNYAHELYFHFNHYLSDVPENPLYPLNTVYNGGQTIYNLPMYFATIASGSFGHAINAILVGDNPLDFNDWRFIEPQNDYPVVPGSWDMPYNTDLNIDVYYNPTAETRTFHTILSFHISESRVTLTGHDPNLVLNRPAPAKITTKNIDYQWYPNMVVSDTAYILYAQTRDDMTRTTDIHIKNTETWKDKPITLFKETSLLLDHFQESDSIIHLLFTSKLTKIPGVYYGKYNLHQNIFSDTVRISSLDPRIVLSGKLIVTGDQIYAFWFLNPIYTMTSAGGIYWNHKSKTTNWKTESLLYQIDYPIFSNKFNGPSIFPYLMDGVSLNNGNLLVVTQSVKEGSDVYSDIIFMHYDGVKWTIDNLNYPLSNLSSLRGLALTYDSNNILHLVFSNPGTWITDVPSICYTTSLDNGYNWQAVSKIDSAQSTLNVRHNIFCSPRLISNNGNLFLTYINRDKPSKIIWRKFEQKEWQSINNIILPENNFAWFPQIAFLPSNKLLFVWSNSSNGNIELTKKIINCSLTPPLKPIGPDTVCQGQNSVTYSVPQIENADSYIWTLPNGAIRATTTNSITINYDLSAVSGNITVKGHNDCGDGASSSLSVVVNSKPSTPIVTLNGNALHSDAITGNQWYNQIGALNEAIDQNYTPKSSGDYYVVVSSNGCCSNSSNSIHFIPTGIYPTKSTKLVKVYPNPVTNELTIELEGNTIKTNFEIINSLGQSIFNGAIFEKTVVQTANFTPGVYLVKLESGKTFEFKKIFKFR